MAADSDDEMIGVAELEEGDLLELIPREPVVVKTDDSYTSVYKNLDELGKGKFGIVFKAKRKSDGKIFAAKFVRKSAASKKEVLREIEMMNYLHHKRLIQLYDAFETKQDMIVIMELVTGGELFEKVVEEDNLTEKQVIRYMKQVLFGVQHMHRKHMVHLDLKPENILCLGGGKAGYEEIKLIDFGMTRVLKDGKEETAMCGTPEFVAPEVITFNPITLASDMWSIGVITYVLLSGLSPFMGDDDSETLKNVASGEYDFEDDDEIFENMSDEVKLFIEDLLILDPKKRLTVSDCLEHTWLRNEGSDKKLNTSNLKKFIARRRWQRTMNTIKAVSRLAGGLSLFGNKGSGAHGAGKGNFIASVKAQQAKEDEEQKKKVAEVKRKADEEAEKKRKEEEAAEKKQIDVEAAEKKRKEAEEVKKKRKEAEEAEKKQKEAEAAEKKRKEAEEVEKRRKEAEEVAAAEKKRKEAEEAAAAEKKRKEAEAVEKKCKEAEAAEKKRKEAEEAAAAEKKREEAEEAAAAEKKRKEVEAAEKKRKEAEEAEIKRKEAEEAEKKRKEAEEAEKKRKEAEEVEPKQKDEAEATEKNKSDDKKDDKKLKRRDSTKKKKDEKAEKKRKEEEERKRKELEKAEKKRQLEAERKRKEEEKSEKKKEKENKKLNEEERKKIRDEERKKRQDERKDESNNNSEDVTTITINGTEDKKSRKIILRPGKQIKINGYNPPSKSSTSPKLNTSPKLSAKEEKSTQGGVANKAAAFQSGEAYQSKIKK